MCHGSLRCGTSPFLLAFIGSGFRCCHRRRVDHSVPPMEAGAAAYGLSRPSRVSKVAWERVSCNGAFFLAPCQGRGAIFPRASLRLRRVSFEFFFSESPERLQAVSGERSYQNLCRIDSVVIHHSMAVAYRP